MGTATNLLRGPCSIYIGTAGTTAFSTSTFTNIGFTTGGGVKITRTLAGNKITVDQTTTNMDFDVTEQSHTVGWTFAELTLANLARALGITGATDTVTLTQDLQFQAIAVQAPGAPSGTNTTLTTRTYLYPDCKPTGDTTINAGEKGVVQNMPVVFEWFQRRTQLPTATDA